MRSSLLVIPLLIGVAMMQFVSACEDKSKKCSSYFKKYTKEKLCSSYKNKNWSWTWCRKSCEMCNIKEEPEPPCIDKKPALCAIHGGTAACENKLYQKNLKKYCRLSCEHCTPNAQDKEITAEQKLKSKENPPTDKREPLVAEVLFIVDHEMQNLYKRFGYSGKNLMEAIRGDVNYYINEVNLLYKSLEKFGMRLEVRPKDIIFADDWDVVTPQNGQTLNTFTLHTRLQKWMNTSGNYEKYKPDATLLFTGYKFGYALGIAAIKSICDPSATGVIQIEGLQRTVNIIAHELGHILGASHSGSGVMISRTYARLEDRWEFTHYSYGQFQSLINILDQKGVNCLKKTTTKAIPYHISSQKGRDIIDLEKLCIRWKGSTDTSFKEKYGRKVRCQYIYCTTSKRSTYSTYVMTPEGSLCQAGRGYCRHGKCIV